MDNADSDQESSTRSSQEGPPRQIDLQSVASPTYRPVSSTRIERSPPEAKSPEAPKPRRIGFGTPITTHPVSPLPPFPDPSDPSSIMGTVPPTADELVALMARVRTLETALAAAAAPAAGSSAVIANPADFQRSPYTQAAPLNLNSKSGLHLYTEVQEPLKILFNGKCDTHSERSP